MITLVENPRYKAFVLIAWCLAWTGHNITPTDGETILGWGEPITTIEDVFLRNLKRDLVGHLDQIATGERLRPLERPVQDNACYYPGCESDHVYEDEHFDEHCDSCHTWLNINVPISILRHSDKDDVATCSDCGDCEEYLEAGYTDDSGKLQRRRADGDALLCMLDLACERAARQGIFVPSGRAFFEGRVTEEATYTSIMNAIAEEWKMGNDDNFDFLKDHANNELKDMYAALDLNSEAE